MNIWDEWPDENGNSGEALQSQFNMLNEELERRMSMSEDIEKLKLLKELHADDLERLSV